MGVFQVLVLLYQLPATPKVGTGVLEMAVTTALVADDAVAEPAELLAVTETRIVAPTSADTTR
jgi:hypothetical protein